MQDFFDQNLDIVIMFRGTDHTHKFTFTPDDGSTFVFSNNVITCEVRRSSATIDAVDFYPPVTTFTGTDHIQYGLITFNKTDMTNQIRENKLYYRVLATSIDTNLTIVINYGEVWLK